ncbi:MAG: hypothetical protein HY435_01760 [Candidatus Liptonbacteria bacterium]|nr:hypothetical protein [Candidatus Liptonbacteria bacterium]
MNKKRAIITPLVLSFIGLLVGYVLINPIAFSLCRSEYIYHYGDLGSITNPPTIGCLDPIMENIGEPLLIGSIPIIVIFLALLLVGESIFITWQKFAKIYLPIAVALIIFAPSDGGGFFPGMFDKEITTWFVSGLYLAVSLGIIIFKGIKLRRQHG